MEAAEHLARLPVRVFFVVLPKTSTPANSAMIRDEVDQARNRVGMQWADVAGRAVLKATTRGASPPHRTEPVYLETLAPVIWRRRPVETYGIKSVMPDWHLTQPWWNKVTDAVPEGET